MFLQKSDRKPQIYLELLNFLYTFALLKTKTKTRNKMKIFLKNSLVLILALIVSVASYAQDAFIDGIYYNLNNNTKEATVTNRQIGSTYS